ncbi:hypothetical protein [Sphingomonas faeni]|uniref:hypothetical protein n=1 Tax=Sphingomonas faeni TaxID=185950 RepID=UPI0020C81FFA|nr:hypothetical protein [Sphingomonas faeni]MCP8890315.1 hypothetical protein [Sphingomonas faeni]
MGTNFLPNAAAISAPAPSDMITTDAVSLANERHPQRGQSTAQTRRESAGKEQRSHRTKNTGFPYIFRTGKWRSN